jgi:hypothetical protein
MRGRKRKRGHSPPPLHPRESPLLLFSLCVCVAILTKKRNAYTDKVLESQFIKVLYNEN